MKKPSIVGEASAVIAVIDFIIWVSTNAPKWTLWIWVVFGFLFIFDWMMGGVSDKGLFKGKF